MIHINKTGFVLSICLLLSSCATSLFSVQTDAQKTNPGNGILVGSFLIEPVPEWKHPRDNYWLSIWRRKPLKEYKIDLAPDKEADLIMELPEGTYTIQSIYEGKFLSGGHGRKGEMALQFKVNEGEISYNGHLRLIIAKEPEHLRRQREEIVQTVTAVLTYATLGHPMLAGPQRPMMYTAAVIENNFQEAIKWLQNKGWNESAIKKINKSLIVNPKSG